MESSLKFRQSRRTCGLCMLLLDVMLCVQLICIGVGTINGLEVLTDATFDNAIGYGFTNLDIKVPTAYSNVLLARCCFLWKEYKKSI